MQFEIVRETEEKLDRVVFRFGLETGLGMQTPKLKLDSYRVEARETRRHGYVLEAGYSRVRGRLTVASSILREDVPLTAEIEAEAKEYVAEIIRELKIQ